MAGYSPITARSRYIHMHQINHPNNTATASVMHSAQPHHQQPASSQQQQPHHLHHHAHHGFHGGGGAPLAPYQIHQHQHSSGSRRRESANSSIGANSIRHLLSIKRSIGTNCTGFGGTGTGDHRGGSGSGGGGCIANSRSSGTGGLGAGCRHKFPPHVKAKVARNFAILCAAHALSCAILVPLFGLQVGAEAECIFVLII